MLYYIILYYVILYYAILYYTILTRSSECYEVFLRCSLHIQPPLYVRSHCNDPEP